MIAVIKVSTELGNLSGKQLLLLLNLSCYKVCLKFNITVKLKKIFVEVLFIIFVSPMIRLRLRFRFLVKIFIIKRKFTSSKEVY